MQTRNTLALVLVMTGFLKWELAKLFKIAFVIAPLGDGALASLAAVPVGMTGVCEAVGFKRMRRRWPRHA